MIEINIEHVLRMPDDQFLEVYEYVNSIRDFLDINSPLAHLIFMRDSDATYFLLRWPQ